MKDNSRLTLVYILYITGVFLGWNIINLYFFKQGFEVTEIIFYYLLFSLSSVVSVVAINRMGIRRSMRLSQILRIICFLLVIHFYVKLQLYLLALILGVTVELFWTPYYSLSQQFSLQKEKYQKLSYLGTLLKILAPAAGGLIAAKFGYTLLFIICIIIFLLNVENTSSLEEEKMNVSLLPSLKTIRGLKTLVLLEGIFQTIPFILVPLVTLSYLQSEVHYGLFFSYLALFTGLSLFILHKGRRRKKYEIILLPIVAILGILAGLSSSLIAWALFIGLMTLTWKVSESFTTSLLMKQSYHFTSTVVVRRFFIALGRVAGSLLTLIIIMTYARDFRQEILLLQLSIILLSLSFMLYPLVLIIKKKRHRSW